MIDRFDAGTAWDLLGYHTGSLIAMDMTLRRPNRIRKLVMVSVPLLTEAEIGRYASLGLGKNLGLGPVGRGAAGAMAAGAALADAG